MAARRRPGTLGPETRAIAHFGHLKILLQIMDKNSEYASTEEGKDVNVYIKVGKGSAALNLTSLTREELDAVGAMLATAFELAAPICEMRDQRAIEREEAGDDDDSGEYLWRLYRQVPEVLVRNGEVYEHDPELQLRSTWVADLDAFRVRDVKRSADVPGRRRSLLDGPRQGLGDFAEDAGT